MDFMELCNARQSCRSYADKPVEHEKLVKCVEAARLAPSGCNSQPWKFVVVETPEVVEKVAKCTQVLGANSYISSAKAFIVVLEEHAVLLQQVRAVFDSQVFAKGDLGAAAVTICYAAQEQGLGSCILGLFDRAALSNILSLPLEQRYFCVIALGYENDTTTRPKMRKPLEEITKFV